MRSWGYTVIPKEKEDYKIDITAVRDGQVEYFEVEVKTGYQWTSIDDYKFPTVSFLGRKKKYGDFWYVMVCAETSAYIMCHSKNIYQEEYREKIKLKTGEHRGTDVVYRVPKEYCLWGNFDV